MYNYITICWYQGTLQIIIIIDCCLSIMKIHNLFVDQKWPSHKYQVRRKGGKEEEEKKKDWKKRSRWKEKRRRRRRRRKNRRKSEGGGGRADYASCSWSAQWEVCCWQPLFANKVASVCLVTAEHYLQPCHSCWEIAFSGNVGILYICWLTSCSAPLRGSI